MKRILTLLMTMTALLGLSITAQAATYSSYWVEENGVWKIKDPSGNVVTNAWLCDDAVAENGKDVWYLLDTNGNMLTYGLVQDKTGNYYSLEMDHNGYYGMLRYKSGTYDGVTLELESSHDGAFAAIKNETGRKALADKYGVVQIDIDNSNIVYTSSYESTSHKNSTGSAAAKAGNLDNKTPTSEDIWTFLTNDYGDTPEISYYKIDKTKPEVQSGITNIYWSQQKGLESEYDYNGFVIERVKLEGACDTEGNNLALVFVAINKDGYLYVNTTTPEGYKVNEYGLLTVNGNIVTHSSQCYAGPTICVKNVPAASNNPFLSYCTEFKLPAETLDYNHIRYWLPGTEYGIESEKKGYGVCVSLPGK